MLDRIERLERRCTMLLAGLAVAICPWFFGANPNSSADSITGKEVICQKLTVMSADGKAVGYVSSENGGNLTIPTVTASKELRANAVLADSAVVVGKSKAEGTTVLPTAVVVAQAATPLAIIGAGVGAGDTRKRQGFVMIKDAATGESINIDSSKLEISEKPDGSIVLRKRKDGVKK